jgi:hypothetical protein
MARLSFSNLVPWSEKELHCDRNEEGMSLYFGSKDANIVPCQHHVDNHATRASNLGPNSQPLGSMNKFKKLKIKKAVLLR